jgi:hypothetical protein
LGAIGLIGLQLALKTIIYSFASVVRGNYFINFGCLPIY